MFFFEHHGLEENQSFRHVRLSNYSFPLHFHIAYELIIVNEGQISLTIEQKEYTLTKNDGAFIFNNQMHEFETIDHSNITIIIFSPELVGHFFMKYKGFIPESNVFQISYLPDLNVQNSIYKKKSLLYYLCSLLVDNTKFNPVEYSMKTKVLQKILLFVDNNYSNNCTLKSVAKHLKYDYNYLSKLFIQKTKLTFTEYLNRYRISQACYLLNNSDKSISEIAFSCGYNNLRTFNRNFKKVTTYSPTSYRKLS